jgi:hypothetical protein
LTIVSVVAGFVSFVLINFGPSVGLKRKDFGIFFLIFKNRNGDDDGTIGILIGDSALFKRKYIEFQNVA